MPRLSCVLLLPLVACSASPSDVSAQLAPEVISSLDGTLTVHAAALADKDPATNEAIEITVDYKDRNGVAHTIAPVDGTTDDKGTFDATLTGFTFDGIGTVKVQLLSGAAGSAPLMSGGNPIEADATFSVLDRTPPTVTIMPPASTQVHVNGNATISVHATDEIGIGQVVFQTSGDTGGGGGNGNGRSAVVASGAADTTINFDVQVSQNATIGSMITLYALASDLSGNEQAAAPVVLTVVQ
jgi:hypothetical protein